jgi:hypothetical protein
MKVKRPFKMPKYERYDDSNGRGSAHQWREQFRQFRQGPEPVVDLGGGGPLGVLGLGPSASWIDIRTAYKKLVRLHHPDVGGDASTFRKIQEAYEALELQHSRTR